MLVEVDVLFRSNRGVFVRAIRKDDSIVGRTAIGQFDWREVSHTDAENQLRLL